MSTKQRRGVKFNHKSNGGDGRRLSMSEVSEEGGRSPTKGRFLATLDGSHEVGRPPNPATTTATCADRRVVAPGAVHSGRAEAGRVREEKGKLYNAHLLDVRHDRGLLHGAVPGPHLHHPHNNHGPSGVVQGGHQHCERAQSRPRRPKRQGPQLVLADDDHVLSLRREHALLL